MTDIWCFLKAVLSALLSPGFLMMLQKSSTFLSMKIHNQSQLLSPCSRIHVLSASWLNLSSTYISCSHNAIILNHCAVCAYWIFACTSLGIMHCSRVQSWCSSMFAHSALESSFSSCANSSPGSNPSCLQYTKDLSSTISSSYSGDRMLALFSISAVPSLSNHGVGCPLTGPAILAICRW